MKITKYNHACLLIEDNGKKLLIDPGMFSFNESFTPNDVGPVDAIVVTHPHEDHMAAQAIKGFLDLQPTVVYGGPAIVEALAKDGIEVQTIPEGQKQEAAGFSIEAFPATHGPMPNKTENYAYLINGRLLHPGDSFSASGLPEVEILALPTQGPWALTVDAIQFARDVKPKIAIAIHNALYKDEITPWFDGMIGEQLGQNGVEFKFLKTGESWEA